MIWKVVCGIFAVLSAITMILHILGVLSSKPELTAGLVWLALALIWWHKAVGE